MQESYYIKLLEDLKDVLESEPKNGYSKVDMQIRMAQQHGWYHGQISIARGMVNRALERRKQDEVHS